MHAAFGAAAHLVPVVAGELQLGRGRDLDLGHGHKIVEAGLPSRFLGQEPVHLGVIGVSLQPGEQRIALSRPHDLERLEPIDEPVGIARRRGGLRLHLLAQPFDPGALQPAHPGVLLQLGAPIRRGLRRRQAAGVPGGQLPVESFRIAKPGNVFC